MKFERGIPGYNRNGRPAVDRINDHFSPGLRQPRQRRKHAIGIANVLRNHPEGDQVEFAFATKVFNGGVISAVNENIFLNCLIRIHPFESVATIRKNPRQPSIARKNMVAAADIEPRGILRYELIDDSLIILVRCEVIETYTHPRTPPDPAEVFMAYPKDLLELFLSYDQVSGHIKYSPVLTNRISASADAEVGCRRCARRTS